MVKEGRVVRKTALWEKPRGEKGRVVRKAASWKNSPRGERTPRGVKELSAWWKRTCLVRKVAAAREWVRGNGNQRWSPNRTRYRTAIKWQSREIFIPQDLLLKQLYPNINNFDITDIFKSFSMYKIQPVSHLRRVFWCVRTWPYRLKMRYFYIIKPSVFQYVATKKLAYGLF